MIRRAATLIVALSLAGCGVSDATKDPPRSASVGSGGSSSSGSSNSGSSNSGSSNSGAPHVRPQVVEPTAGVQAAAAVTETAPGDSTPVGDVNAHAPPLSQVEAELRLEAVAATPTSSGYIDPLRYVSVWERTDQGVDAQLPVGAPILAPGRVKILAIEPDWYAGQPLIYWELLDGPDAGKVQYVAEEITDLAQPGSILQQGQVIARYAASGTGIEFGWSTLNGITLAMATSGYEEGEETPAGKSMRAWLNSLGANAGPNF
jgi:hypothetical protein